MSKVVEYELSTFEDELVAVMNWRELLAYLPASYSQASIRKAIQRGQVIAGLQVVKVVYDSELDY